ncbi:MAG: hypothetical protein BWY87_01331 [Deltaproteobacteria bacterium ADurb.Bin510]|nr:MAG: hypothetical protein BWY87_01331 [Deltaproteobacteria bacterium ADurb.Bin510]
MLERKVLARPFVAGRGLEAGVVLAELDLDLAFGRVTTGIQGLEVGAAGIGLCEAGFQGRLAVRQLGARLDGDGLGLRQADGVVQLDARQAQVAAGLELIEAGLVEFDLGLGDFNPGFAADAVVSLRLSEVLLEARHLGQVGGLVLLGLDEVPVGLLDGVDQAGAFIGQVGLAGAHAQAADGHRATGAAEVGDGLADAHAATEAVVARVGRGVAVAEARVPFGRGLIAGLGLVEFGVRGLDCGAGDLEAGMVLERQRNTGVKVERF